MGDTDEEGPVEFLRVLRVELVGEVAGGGESFGEKESSACLTVETVDDVESWF